MLFVKDFRFAFLHYSSHLSRCDYAHDGQSLAAIAALTAKPDCKRARQVLISSIAIGGDSRALDHWHSSSQKPKIIEKGRTSLRNFEAGLRSDMFNL